MTQGGAVHARVTKKKDFESFYSATSKGTVRLPWFRRDIKGHKQDLVREKRTRKKYCVNNSRREWRKIEKVHINKLKDRRVAACSLGGEQSAKKKKGSVHRGIRTLKTPLVVDSSYTEPEYCRITPKKNRGGGGSLRKRRHDSSRRALCQISALEKRPATPKRRCSKRGKKSILVSRRKKGVPGLPPSKMGAAAARALSSSACGSKAHDIVPGQLKTRQKKKGGGRA